MLDAMVATIPTLMVAIIPTLIGILNNKRGQRPDAMYTQEEIALTLLQFSDEMVWSNRRINNPAVIKLEMLLRGAKNTDDPAVMRERMDALDAIWNEGVGKTD